jgi:DNA-binding XRE family transcriptional regulator
VLNLDDFQFSYFDMKPAKIAGNVSPIAALQYTAASTKSSARNCSKMKLSRMAWNNVFRNAKSTTLVFASLFFGLSLFLVVTGLLHGLSPENYVSQWGVSDFALTYSIHLKEVRTEANLSQAQLAEMVGVSRNTISSIETGQFNPTAKLALILAVYFRHVDHPYQRPRGTLYIAERVLSKLFD